MPRFDFAAAKVASRQIVHDTLAVDAVYYDADTPSTPITVRFHTKLATAGALSDGFSAEIIEGIHRLVFNANELIAARGGEGLYMKQGGYVLMTNPAYINMRFCLESEEPTDGPQNYYWTVSQIQPGQVLPPPPIDDSVYLTADDGTIITL